MKSQSIRLLDVFLIGPMMSYIGYKSEGVPQWIKTSMILFGFSTIIYNGANYMKLKNRR